MADENREGSRDADDELLLDAQMTSSFPAGKPDADSWVAQWADLFDDEPDPGPDSDIDLQPEAQVETSESRGSSTREMPIYHAEQPPVSDVVPEPGVLPGHPAPTGRQGQSPTGRQGQSPTGRQGQSPTGEKPARDERPVRNESDAAEIAAWQKSQERSKRRAKLRANQRKARVIQRNRPAGDDIASEDPASFRTSIGSSPKRRTAIVTGGLVMAGAMALIGFALTGFGQSPDDSNLAEASSSVSPSGESLTVGADVGQTDIQDLALSTVQLTGLNDALEAECAGSGVIVDPAGLILTNAHVVTSEGGCQFSSIGIARTVDSSSAPELRYRAEVLVVDEALDLAVVRIAGWLDESRSDDLPESFPSAPLGNSDTVQLGDRVRILGYPVIGGDTITFTDGSVSGFTSQDGVGNRALIKTDATISAGNSGGMAVDANGQVVGIPTKAQASERGPAIDCRPVSDTNGDGLINDSDSCVSVGGFLNGIRPINLAGPILRAATSATPIGPVARPEGPQSTFDFAGAEFGNPRFSLGQIGDRPVEIVHTAEAGVDELCIFFDWSALPVGTPWEGAWFVNGEAEQGLGVRNDVWTQPETGTDFSFCATAVDEAGLPAGVYEVGFFLDGEVQFAEGIVLTEDPVEVVPVTWSNDTGVELCGLAVNPVSDSGQIGMNELEADETIPPDESRTIDLPLGRYVVEAYNCEGEAVADNYEGLLVEGPVTFLIGISPSN